MKCVLVGLVTKCHREFTGQEFGETLVVQMLTCPSHAGKQGTAPERLCALLLVHQSGFLHRNGNDPNRDAQLSLLGLQHPGDLHGHLARDLLGG